MNVKNMRKYMCSWMVECKVEEKNKEEKTYKICNLFRLQKKCIIYIYTLVTQLNYTFHI